MNPSEWGFAVLALFAVVFAIASYLAVKIWGEKK